MKALNNKKEMLLQTYVQVLWPKLGIPLNRLFFALPSSLEYFPLIFVAQLDAIFVAL